MISTEMILVLLPEIGLILLTGALLVISFLKNNRLLENLGWITAAGIGVIAIASFIWAQPRGEPVLLWGEMVRFDQAGFLIKMLILAGTGLTAAFACTDEAIHPKAEFYLLMVLSSIGLMLMASAGNLILLYLAVETASLPLYVLAGIKFRNKLSVESGLKFFLFGAMSSAIMLYGFSLLYGFSGTTRIYSISKGITENLLPLPAVILAAVLVLAGFAFKISAVPFHFWAPDVYEGAPTPVAGFLSTVSKAAGFAALIRILVHIFGTDISNSWMLMVAVMAAVSMFVGNLLAIPQKSIKRMIAFSSIAQAGYILVGVASGTSFGMTGAVYYLMAYLVTNLAVFAIIGWMEKATCSDTLSAFAGLNRKSPGLALLMMISLLSLGGIPPFSGFFAKVLVFGAAIESGLVWLAVIGILNSVIALYYYLRVLKTMYLDEPLCDRQPENPPICWTVGLAICILGIIILGVIYSPWFQAATHAAAGF